MKTIRIGNDINVVWKIFSRNGMKFSLEGKILRLWLMSGPFKKEITDFEVQLRNEVRFFIDADDLHRLGVYKILLSVLDDQAETEDASFDVTEVFQLVSRSYFSTENQILDGKDILLVAQSILTDAYTSPLEGASAYEIAVKHGFEGTEEEWLTLPTGIKGVGIESVELVGEYSSESSAANTYRITLNTGDTFDFSVNNGNGIVSIEQTETATEPDGDNTILVTLSDGSTAEFKVKNGTGITGIQQTVASIENGGINKAIITLSNGETAEIQFRNGKSSAGLYPTSSALESAIPSPKVGDYAFVGDSFPAAIYVCVTEGTWEDSGEEYDGDSVDLSNYATKEKVADAVPSEFNPILSWVDGMIYNGNGVSTNASYQLSSPFLLKKGYTVKFTGGKGSTTLSINAISKYNNGAYSKILEYSSDPETIEYTATDDVTIAVSTAKSSYGGSVKIQSAPQSLADIEALKIASAENAADIAEINQNVKEISENYPVVLKYIREDSSGVQDSESIPVTPGETYYVSNSSSSVATAIIKFYDSSDVELLSSSVEVGSEASYIAPLAAVRLDVISYRAMTVVVSIKGQIKKLDEKLTGEIAAVAKDITTYVGCIDQNTSAAFSIEVTETGIDVTPKGYYNQISLANISPFSASFGTKSIIVVKYYNSTLSAEAVNNLEGQSGIIAVFVKAAGYIWNPYCAKGVRVTPSGTTKFSSGFLSYQHSCVHATPEDFSWCPLLHALMRVESTDTTKDIYLRYIKRGGANLDPSWYYRILIGFDYNDTTYQVWCSPTTHDTYEGESIIDGFTVKAVVNKTLADYICPSNDEQTWPWKGPATHAYVSTVAYGILNTQESITDTAKFPGYIEDSEFLYDEDSNISQMVPMTRLMVNHETVGASFGAVRQAYYDSLYGKKYNPNAKSGYGYRIVWGKVAFDGTNYDFSETIDNVRYPDSVASAFLHAYRNGSRICFRFEMFSGQEYDPYVKKPSIIPQSLQTWITSNNYSWNSSDILVDSSNNEVHIGCPISVLTSMLEEGKAPYLKSTGSGKGWYFDHTSDALYDAFMELHSQFSDWLDTPLLDENGVAVTSSFYGETKSITYRDVLSEFQFGLGIYSEGSIKDTPNYQDYPFSSLERYYTEILELFPEEMVFFGNAMCYDVGVYFTAEDLFDVWEMSNTWGRVGIFLDAIGANVISYARQLTGIFPFSGEGYQATSYNIDNYLSVARYFNVHSYHYNNFQLPAANNNGATTTIASAALRAFNIMIRLFGPHLWYQYLGGSSSLGWVEFTIENIGLHYMFDTGRRLYLVLRSNDTNDVVLIKDLTSVCDVTTLAPKEWDKVGVPSGQNRYRATFTPANNCSMYLTLVNPKGFQEAFWFNNNGRNEHGEYPLIGIIS